MLRRVEGACGSVGEHGEEGDDQGGAAGYSNEDTDASDQLHEQTVLLPRVGPENQEGGAAEEAAEGDDT